MCRDYGEVPVITFRSRLHEAASQATYFIGLIRDPEEETSPPRWAPSALQEFPTNN